MAGGGIPEEVKRFIHANVNSVEQLEVLLLLRNHQEKEWTVKDISQKLYIQPDSATTRLSDLSEKGLVSVRQEAESLYRYAPPSSEVENVIGSLDRAYKERKDSVIQLIFSKPLDHIQVFSDAFRFRRKD